MATVHKQHAVDLTQIENGVGVIAFKNGVQSLLSSDTG
jgi:hypothetical protein